MSAKRIAEGWEDFRRRVIPATASRVQVDETRNGFYAGAWLLLSTIMSALEPGHEATAADLTMLDEIYDELQKFAKSKAG
jgi:hypothetical protein